MNRKLILPLLLLLALAACNQSNTGTTTNQRLERDTLATDTSGQGVAVREETVTYKADTATMLGYVAYDANAREKLPIVLVIPEWWGLNDYARRRARELAELGYFAFAVDMYGQGRTAANPQEAQAMAGPFYENTMLGRTRVAAALDQARSFDQSDDTRTAAIGYCFGGAMALNAARQGLPFNGVVSFHGNLAGPAPVEQAKNTRVLVLHGADDNFVPAQEIDAFKKQMDAAGIRYRFVAYPGATHAFTNPDATEAGKKFKLPIAYNAAADTASWQEMRAFFGEVLGK